MQFVTSLDISGQPTIIETVSLAPVDLDLLWMSQLPQLGRWFSGANAASAGGNFTWADRISSAIAVHTQPSFLPTIGAINGKPAVQFNAAGARIPGDTLLGAHAFSRLMVVKPAVQTGLIAYVGSASGSGPLIGGYHNPIGTLRLDNNPTTASDEVRSAAAFFPNTTTSVISMGWNDTTNTLKYRRNLGPVMSVAYTEAPGDAGTGTVLGAQGTSTTGSVTGLMAEFMQFPADDMYATADNVSAIEAIIAKFITDYAIT